MASTYCGYPFIIYNLVYHMSERVMENLEMEKIKTKKKSCWMFYLMPLSR